MTQKYMKIYPTTDDIGKTPIVVEDVEGLNGVNIEFSEALNISELADDTFLYKTTVASVPVLISKTVAEMKTVLGLPSKVYKAYINTTSTTIDPREIENTFDGTLTWSRSDVGVLSLVSADSEFTDDKTIIHCTMRRTSLATIVVAEDHYEIIFRLYNNAGALTDGLDFFLTIEVYE